MPSRPENRKRYPKGWKAISKRIRFDRAGSRCECRGECGTDHQAEVGHNRCNAINYRDHPITGSSVVLTVAHLNHVPEHCHDSNLRAMCQRCHLRYDAPMKATGRRRRMGMDDLFEQASPARNEASGNPASICPGDAPGASAEK